MIIIIQLFNVQYTIWFIKVKKKKINKFGSQQQQQQQLFTYVFDK